MVINRKSIDRFLIIYHYCSLYIQWKIARVFYKPIISLLKRIFVNNKYLQSGKQLDTLDTFEEYIRDWLTRSFTGEDFFSYILLGLYIPVTIMIFSYGKYLFTFIAILWAFLCGQYVRSACYDGKMTFLILRKDGVNKLIRINKKYSVPKRKWIICFSAFYLIITCLFIANFVFRL